MTPSHAADGPRLVEAETWSWWESRRALYNLVLAAAGWASYAAAVAISYGFDHPVWSDARGALGVTLFLGVAYLVVMGAANVMFLLGVAVEAWVRPGDVARYRERAFRLGLLGSALLPFSFPLIVLAQLIAKG